MLDFEQLPSLFPELTVWGARTVMHSFVISYNTNCKDQGYRASYRVIGEHTIDLGRFDNKEAAIAACVLKAKPQ